MLVHQGTLYVFSLVAYQTLSYLQSEPPRKYTVQVDVDAQTCPNHMYVVCVCVYIYTHIFVCVCIPAGTQMTLFWKIGLVKFGLKWLSVQNRDHLGF